MVVKVKTIRRIKYYLSPKDIERIYNKLGELNMSLSEYALSRGIAKSSLQQILNGEIPITKSMYTRAFKDFGCIENVPDSYNK